MNRQKNSPNNQPAGNSGHGFGLGLLVGGVAGIASYYLLGTEDGKRLKQKLIEEFEYAQIKIPQEISQILTEQEDQDVQSAATATEPGESTNLLAKLAAAIKPSGSSADKKEAKTKSTPNKPSKHFFTKSGKKIY